MSDWHWYESKPKRPPPERGIRMKKSGATWWGKRWLEALERMSAGYKNRLARGRSYARGGRTHDLIVKPGVVTARVTGTRATPYKVRIAIPCLSDTAWSKAVAAMAAEARFAAALLGGEMPADIDTAFGQGRTGLFPTRASDLDTSCSCPDWANPCKHVAATHYVLGEALDQDPFLLFELRGRDKAQVLSALRSARSGERPQAAMRSGVGGGGKAAKRTRRTKSVGTKPRANETAANDAVDAVPAVSLGRLRKADYDRPRAPPPTLHLMFDTPPVPGAVLRQLGAPPGWSSARSPAELLGPVVRAAAEAARRIALMETEEMLLRGQAAEESSQSSAGAGRRGGAKSKTKSKSKSKKKKTTTKTNKKARSAAAARVTSAKGAPAARKKRG